MFCPLTDGALPKRGRPGGQLAATILPNAGHPRLHPVRVCPRIAGALRPYAPAKGEVYA